MLACCYNLQDMIRRFKKLEKRSIFVQYIYICLCMYINYGLMCLCLNRRRCSYIACKMQNHNNATCSCVTIMLSSNQPHLTLLWYLTRHFLSHTWILISWIEYMDTLSVTDHERISRINKYLILYLGVYSHGLCKSW